MPGETRHERLKRSMECTHIACIKPGVKTHLHFFAFEWILFFKTITIFTKKNFKNSAIFKYMTPKIIANYFEQHIVFAVTTNKD